MINTSDEYRQLIRRNRTFLSKASLTLSDSTTLNLAPADIMQGGIKIDDSVGEKVTLGSATINKCTITLNNFSGKFDTYNFTGAIVRPQIGLQLSNTVEYLAKGVFTANRPTVAGSIIVLEALDNMALFDTEFSAVSISFPCTALQLLQTVCLHCGVYLATASFRNSTYTIDNRPDDASVSCREIVSWIAQIAGCFARCNAQGALELRWFDFEAFEAGANLDGGTFDNSNPYSSGDNADGGNFTDYKSGDNYDGGTFLDMKRYHHLYSFSGEPTVGTDDIYITGIQVTDSSENPTTVLFGSSGYVLPIKDNKLIQNAGQAAAVANSIGQKIVGMRFRSFSGNTQSDPAMEAGDVAWASTRKGNSYPVLFTSLGFALGNTETVTCGAETPAQSNYRPTQEMKAIVEARKVAKQQINSYDLAQQTFNNLVFHSFGVHRTVEDQPDGSKIEYSHDKPTLAESQNIWKQTAGVFAVSNDGGHTWRGMDAAGNILATVLNAIGVNAEWIKVLTSFTVGNNFSVNSAGILHATNAILSGQVNATSGQIGPFRLDNTGLFGQLIEIYEQSNYPFMWFTKPGDSGWGSNNSQRANIEPALVVVREKKDGVETDTSIYARDDGTGTRGKVQISKDDGTGNISTTALKDGALQYEKWENGLLKEGFDLNHEGLTVNIDGTLRSIFFRDDDIYIDGVGWRATLNRIAALEV